MDIGNLPDDGELQLGPVRLPAGRRIVAGYGSGQPVAWATTQPVAEPGSVWAALSGAHQETGLVPILLDGLDGDPKRPWDDGEFEEPAEAALVDRLDAAVVLADDWADALEQLGDGDADDEADDNEARALRAPFTRQFPGLAPAQETALSPVRLREVLSGLPPARIGLVPARRPADVLPSIGWGGVANWHDSSLPIAAVLRSWEERFGARLLEVGFAQIRLVVERPPATLDQARRVAAEQYAFCDECGDGLADVPRIAASLVGAPLWSFWWD